MTTNRTVRHLDVAATTMVLLGVVQLAGCGGTSQRDLPWAGNVETRDGVEWIANPAEPLWTDDDSPRLTLELEQSFGSEEGPAETMLTWARHLTVDGDGNVYVYDGRDNRIVAFRRPWRTALERRPIRPGPLGVVHGAGPGMERRRRSLHFQPIRHADR
ncbi:MAG: hypothetical protein GKS06_08040 [Acidobacteria bacterium]|nr:hypothetical protein [Acidobacteriota bacterium]